jgi:hypothetical protein
MTPTQPDKVSTAENVLTKENKFTTRLYKIGVKLKKKESVTRKEQFE